MDELLRVLGAAMAAGRAAPPVLLCHAADPGLYGGRRGAAPQDQVRGAGADRPGRAWALRRGCEDVCLKVWLARMHLLHMRIPHRLGAMLWISF